VVSLNLVINASNLAGGEIETHPSKYLTLLSCAVAALCPNKTTIDSPLIAKDTSAMMKACEIIGCTVKRSQGKWSIWGVEKGFTPSQTALHLKNSETALSLMCALTSLSKVPTVLTGDPSICKRAMPELTEALRRIGIKIYSTKQEESPPFLNFGGSLAGGTVNLKSIPMRHIPPVMLVAPYAQKDVRLLMPRTKFRFQVDSMIEIMKKARCSVKGGDTLEIPSTPYGPLNYEVGRELSSVIPFIIASGMLGSKLTIRSKHRFSKRDEAIADVLRAFGLDIKLRGNHARVDGGNLRGTSVDISWGPELFPFFAVLSCFSRGTTRVEGISEARRMKSDRVATVTMELKKMGASILDRGDSVIIKGPCKLAGREVDGHDDHAVAAALAVAGMGAEGRTVIRGGADALGTTYSRFVSTFKSLGADISYSG
jgi:3-phosphoshikimate 1-carboxyvinyltransferase